MALNVPTLGTFEYKFIRKAIRKIVETAAPLATVHAEWKLELDVKSGLGKVTAALKGKGAHSEIVHCWMIGTANDLPITSNGEYRYSGNNKVEYLLTFAIWGFFEYEGWRTQFGSAETIAPDTPAPETVEAGNVSAYAENESRALKAWFRANPTLDLTTANIRAFPFGAENMDVHGFSNGSRIYVVEGFLPVRVKESFV